MIISAEVHTEVKLAQEQAFERLVHIDVPTVFTGRGLIAAVEKTEPIEGDWCQVGDRRWVIMSDQSRLQERILKYQKPHFFAYQLEKISGPLAFLVQSIEGDWIYRFNQSRQATSIHWRYDFRARNALIYPLAWCFVRMIWMPYMRQVINKINTALSS